MNPNNCAKCEHKAATQGSWCYMFLDEPTVTCMCHTVHRGMTSHEAIDMMGAMQRRGEAWQFSKTPHQMRQCVPEGNLEEYAHQLRETLSYAEAKTYGIALNEMLCSLARVNELQKEMIWTSRQRTENGST